MEDKKFTRYLSLIFALLMVIQVFIEPAYALTINTKAENKKNSLVTIDTKKSKSIIQDEDLKDDEPLKKTIENNLPAVGDNLKKAMEDTLTPTSDRIDFDLKKPLTKTPIENDSLKNGKTEADRKNTKNENGFLNELQKEPFGYEVSNAKITLSPKTSYKQGEALDLLGMQIEISLPNNTKRVMTLDDVLRDGGSVFPQNGTVLRENETAREVSSEEAIRFGYTREELEGKVAKISTVIVTINIKNSSPLQIPVEVISLGEKQVQLNPEEKRIAETLKNGTGTFLVEPKTSYKVGENYNLSGFKIITKDQAGKVEVSSYEDLLQREEVNISPKDGDIVSLNIYNLLKDDEFIKDESEETKKEIRELFPKTIVEDEDTLKISIPGIEEIILPFTIEGNEKLDLTAKELLDAYKLNSGSMMILSIPKMTFSQDETLNLEELKETKILTKDENGKLEIKTLEELQRDGAKINDLSLRTEEKNLEEQKTRLKNQESEIKKSEKLVEKIESIQKIETKAKELAKANLEDKKSMKLRTSSPIETNIIVETEKFGNLSIPISLVANDIKVTNLKNVDVSYFGMAMETGIKEKPAATIWTATIDLKDAKDVKEIESNFAAKENSNTENIKIERIVETNGLEEKDISIDPTFREGGIELQQKQLPEDEFTNELLKLNIKNPVLLGKDLKAGHKYVVFLKADEKDLKESYNLNHEILIKKKEQDLKLQEQQEPKIIEMDALFAKEVLNLIIIPIGPYSQNANIEPDYHYDDEGFLDYVIWKVRTKITPEIKHLWHNFTVTRDSGFGKPELIRTEKVIGTSTSPVANPDVKKEGRDNDKFISISLRQPSATEIGEGSSEYIYYIKTPIRKIQDYYPLDWHMSIKEQERIGNKVGEEYSTHSRFAVSGSPKVGVHQRKISEVLSSAFYYLDENGKILATSSIDGQQMVDLKGNPLSEDKKKQIAIARNIVGHYDGNENQIRWQVTDTNVKPLEDPDPITKKRKLEDPVTSKIDYQLDNSQEEVVFGSYLFTPRTNLENENVGNTYEKTREGDSKSYKLKRGEIAQYELVTNVENPSKEHTFTTKLDGEKPSSMRPLKMPLKIIKIWKTGAAPKNLLFKITQGSSVEYVSLQAGSREYISDPIDIYDFSASKGFDENIYKTIEREVEEEPIHGYKVVSKTVIKETNTYIFTNASDEGGNVTYGITSLNPIRINQLKRHYQQTRVWYDWGGDIEGTLRVPKGFRRGEYITLKLSDKVKTSKIPDPSRKWFTIYAQDANKKPITTKPLFNVFYSEPGIVKFYATNDLENEAKFRDVEAYFKLGEYVDMTGKNDPEGMIQKLDVNGGQAIYYNKDDIIRDDINEGFTFNENSFFDYDGTDGRFGQWKPGNVARGALEKIGTFESTINDNLASYNKIDTKIWVSFYDGFTQQDKHMAVKIDGEGYLRDGDPYIDYVAIINQGRYSGSGGIQNPRTYNFQIKNKIAGYNSLALVTEDYNYLNSFDVYVTKKGNEVGGYKPDSLKEIGKNDKSHPSGKYVQINYNSNGSLWITPYNLESDETLVVKFRTRVVERGGNSVRINFNCPPVPGSPYYAYINSRYNHTVGEGGGIVHDTTGFKIVKVEKTEDGKLNPIKNNSAKFLLKGIDEPVKDPKNDNFIIKPGNNDILLTISTDADGVASFDGLPEGNYVLTEIEAPEGYKPDTKEYKVVITEDYKVFIDKNPVEGIMFPIENKKGDKPLIVKKLDQNGEPLKGAEFTIYNRKSDGTLGVKFRSQYVVGENAEAIFNGIPKGNYSLVETRVPNGYKTPNFRIDFTVDEDGNITNVKQVANKNQERSFFNKILGAFKKENIDANDFELKYEENKITFTIKNQLRKNTSFRMKKVDESTGKPLKGVKFKLQKVDENGDPIVGSNPQVISTDQNGIIEFIDLEDGEYILEEVEAPKGYKKLETKWTITIENGKVTARDNSAEENNGFSLEEKLERSEKWNHLKNNVNARLDDKTSDMVENFAKARMPRDLFLANEDENQLEFGENLIGSQFKNGPTAKEYKNVTIDKKLLDVDETNGTATVELTVKADDVENKPKPKDIVFIIENRQNLEYSPRGDKRPIPAVFVKEYLEKLKDELNTSDIRVAAVQYGSQTFKDGHNKIIFGLTSVDDAINRLDNVDTINGPPILNIGPAVDFTNGLLGTKDGREKIVVIVSMKPARWINKENLYVTSGRDIFIIQKDKIKNALSIKGSGKADSIFHYGIGYDNKAAYDIAEEYYKSASSGDGFYDSWVSEGTEDSKKNQKKYTSEIQPKIPTAVNQLVSKGPQTKDVVKDAVIKDQMDLDNFEYLGDMEWGADGAHKNNAPTPQKIGDTITTQGITLEAGETFKITYKIKAKNEDGIAKPVGIQSTFKYGSDEEEKFPQPNLARRNSNAKHIPVTVTFDPNDDIDIPRTVNLIVTSSKGNVTRENVNIEKSGNVAKVLNKKLKLQKIDYQTGEEIRYTISAEKIDGWVVSSFGDESSGFNITFTKNSETESREIPYTLSWKPENEKPNGGIVEVTLEATLNATDGTSKILTEEEYKKILGSSATLKEYIPANSTKGSIVRPNKFKGGGITYKILSAKFEGWKANIIPSGTDGAKILMVKIQEEEKLVDVDYKIEVTKNLESTPPLDKIKLKLVAMIGDNILSDEEIKEALRQPDLNLTKDIQVTNKIVKGRAFSLNNKAVGGKYKDRFIKYSLKLADGEGDQENAVDNYSVVITKDENGTIVINLTDIQLVTIKNTPVNKGKLILTKVEEGDNYDEKNVTGTGKVIPNIPFLFIDSKGHAKEYRTNESGKIILEGILPGTYYLKEKASDDRHIKNDTIWEIKVDDKTGRITYRTVREVQDPATKKITYEPQEGKDWRELSNNELGFEMLVVNRNKPFIEFKKFYKNGGATYPGFGAKFTLNRVDYDLVKDYIDTLSNPKDATIEGITEALIGKDYVENIIHKTVEPDGDGKIYMDSLDVGLYRLYEYQSLGEQYITPKGPVAEFLILPNGEEVILRVTNSEEAERRSRNIENFRKPIIDIFKKDFGTKNPISGAIFQLERKEEKKQGKIKEAFLKNDELLINRTRRSKDFTKLEIEKNPHTLLNALRGSNTDENGNPIFTLIGKKNGEPIPDAEIEVQLKVEDEYYPFYLGKTKKDGTVGIALKAGNELKLIITYPGKKDSFTYEISSDGKTITSKDGKLIIQGSTIQTTDSFVKTVEFIINKKDGTSVVQKTDTSILVEKLDNTSIYKFYDTVNYDENSKSYKITGITEGEYRFTQLSVDSGYKIVPEERIIGTVSNDASISFKPELKTSDTKYIIENIKIEEEPKEFEWIKVGEPLISDTEGHIRLIEKFVDNSEIGLSEGEYRLIETQIPEGYAVNAKDNIVMTFKVNEMGQVVDVVFTNNNGKIYEDKKETYDIYNVKKSDFAFKLVKLDGTSKEFDKDENLIEKKITGAEFEIYQDIGFDDEGNYILRNKISLEGNDVFKITEEKGLVIRGLQVGKYLLKEIKAPDGFILPEKKLIPFEIKLDDQEGAVDEYKLEARGAEIIPEKELEAEVEGQKIPHYQLKVENFKNPELKIRKYEEINKNETPDQEGDNYLEGAEFILLSLKNKRARKEEPKEWTNEDNYDPVKKSDGASLVITTNKDGYATVESQYLNPGVYALKEEKAPDKYVSRKELAVFEVDEQGVITPWQTKNQKYNDKIVEEKQKNSSEPLEIFYIENQPEKTVELKILKTNELGETITKGQMEIELYRIKSQGDFSDGEDKNEVLKIEEEATLRKVVDLNSKIPKIIFSNLEFRNGRYYLKEAVAPEGHALSRHEWIIEVNLDEKEIKLIAEREDDKKDWNIKSGTSLSDAKGEILVGKRVFGSKTYPINKSLKVTDMRIIFPATGGIGAPLYTLGGMMLMAAAYVLSKRKRVITNEE